MDRGSVIAVVRFERRRTVLAADAAVNVGGEKPFSLRLLGNFNRLSRS
jgi:hypothetical protein